MQSVEIQHVTKTPGVCGGKACIAGHRIRVMDIVVWHEMRGYSPDEIVDMFPGITLADVHAALAYYFDHRQEIEADFKRDDLPNTAKAGGGADYEGPSFEPSISPAGGLYRPGAAAVAPSDHRRYTADGNPNVSSRGH